MTTTCSSFVPPTISFHDQAEKIAESIRDHGKNGIFLVESLLEVPFHQFSKMFEVLKSDPSVGERLNKAYTNNLVYKDSFAAGRGGDNVDMKRVLDLSPERIQDILSRDPQLFLTDSAEKAIIDVEITEFWQTCTTTITDKLLHAISIAIGSNEVLNDVHFNYRAAEYYERSESCNPPRCGEHRDFGTFTLIFADRPGLQVMIDGEWKDVVVPSKGSALLLFGWCTQIRSNGRISAALHRVADEPVSSIVPRRLSAVLFVAPKNPTTLLTPITISADEPIRYKSGIRVGQLRGSMARKWQKREGTLIKETDRIWEEQDILLNGSSQDEVVKRNYEVLVDVK